jgi:hypothetical protein
MQSSFLILFHTRNFFLEPVINIDVAIFGSGDRSTVRTSSLLVYLCQCPRWEPTNLQEWLLLPEPADRAHTP